MFSHSSTSQRRRRLSGPSSQYVSADDLLTELLVERQRNMYLSRDATFDDFQERLEARRQHDEKGADLADWMTVREKRMREELEELAAGLSEQTRERRSREAAAMRERERARRAAETATAHAVEEAARRRLNEDTRSRAAALAHVDEERRKMGVAAFQKIEEEHQRVEAHRRSSQQFISARKESNVQSHERAKVYARAVKEAKGKAQLTDARARMRRVDAERKASVRTDKDRQEQQRRAFASMMAQRKAQSQHDAAVKKEAERALARRSREALEKREARGSEQPRIWPVSAPRLVRRAPAIVAQLVAPSAEVRPAAEVRL